MAAWQEIETTDENPLVDYLAADPAIQQYLDGNELQLLMNASRYLGNAPQRARQLADTIRDAVAGTE